MQPPAQFGDHGRAYGGVTIPLRKHKATIMEPQTLSTSSRESNALNELNEDRVEVLVTVAGSETKGTSLFLPRQIYDALSASEKATLPRIYEK
jgi:hypothetical protein